MRCGLFCPYILLVLPRLLHEITFQCSAFVNCNTGCSSNEVIYGHNLQSHLDLLLHMAEQQEHGDVRSYVQLASNHKAIWEDISANLFDSLYAMVERYDRGAENR